MATTQLKDINGTNIFPKVECNNTLTSTDANVPLSAAQGKVLNDTMAKTYVFDSSKSYLTADEYNELENAIINKYIILIDYSEGVTQIGAAINSNIDESGITVVGRNDNNVINTWSIDATTRAITTKSYIDPNDIIKTGYIKNGNKYPIQLDSNNKAYVDLTDLQVSDSGTPAPEPVTEVYVFALTYLDSDTIAKTDWSELISAYRSNKVILISYNDGDNNIIVPNEIYEKDTTLTIKFNYNGNWYRLEFDSTNADSSTTIPYTSTIISTISKASDNLLGTIQTGYVKNGNKFPVSTDVDGNAYVDLSSYTPDVPATPVAPTTETYIFNYDSKADGLTAELANKLINTPNEVDIYIHITTTSSETEYRNIYSKVIRKDIYHRDGNTDVLIRLGYFNELDNYCDLLFNKDGSYSGNDTLTVPILTNYTKSGNKYPIERDIYNRAYVDLTDIVNSIPTDTSGTTPAPVTPTTETYELDYTTASSVGISTELANKIIDTPNDVDIYLKMEDTINGNPIYYYSKVIRKNIFYRDGSIDINIGLAFYDNYNDLVELTFSKDGTYFSEDKISTNLLTGYTQVNNNYPVRKNGSNEAYVNLDSIVESVNTDIQSVNTSIETINTNIESIKTDIQSIPSIDALRINIGATINNVTNVGDTAYVTISNIDAAYECIRLNQPFVIIHDDGTAYDYIYPTYIGTNDGIDGLEYIVHFIHGTTEYTLTIGASSECTLTLVEELATKTDVENATPATTSFDYLIVTGNIDINGGTQTFSDANMYTNIKDIVLNRPYVPMIFKHDISADIYNSIIAFEYDWSEEGNGDIYLTIMYQDIDVMEAWVITCHSDNTYTTARS